jgi:serine protease Do
MIMDASGLALTNAHVVDRAREIDVVTIDGVHHKASVVGVDEVTDLALLRLASDAAPFPALAFADSEAVRVGDWVLAVGSPFGLDATVTAGIISAKARNLETGPFDDFLQTDAAINPGNSGGPLVDARGKVVGINSAMAVTGPGIAFAIPSNLARGIANELARTGKVRRGRIGVTIQPLTKVLAQTFGVSGVTGVLLADVAPDGPAARAGVKAGDIVTRFDGKPVSTPLDLQRAVGLSRPGQVVPLIVRRNGAEQIVEVTIDESVQGVAATAPSQPRFSGLGFSVQAITPGLARRLRLPSAAGVLVAKVDAGGAAARAGIRPGDVISEVNRQPVGTMADFMRLTRGTVERDAVVLRARRGTSSFYAEITVP